MTNSNSMQKLNVCKLTKKVYGHRVIKGTRGSFDVLHSYQNCRYLLSADEIWGMERPQTHIKLQVTQHGFLPSLLGDADQGIEIVYGEEKIFSSRLTRAAKAEQKSLVPNVPTKKGPCPL